MTHRREIQQHRESIIEIRNIMNSMKNLAYLETRKLDRFIGSQRAVIKSIDSAALDLIAHYPDIVPAIDSTHDIYLLLGTERGFCGDFNQAIIRRMEETVAERDNNFSVIAMGSKLHLLLEGNPRVASYINGATVSDEVLPILSGLISEIVSIRGKYGNSMLHAISFSDQDNIETQILFPPFSLSTHPLLTPTTPPVLNLSPEQTLLDLGDHYLFARLNGLIYDSLMAENQRRISHLDSAVRKLDDETEELRRKGNTLRQEEIIEEIEVILLNTSMQDPTY